jgi:flavin-dependent dehydrogenase
MIQQHALPSSCDVVVIGGGPAGAALATFLQRQGHTCLVLNSSVFPRYHIGESLIPHTYGTLDRLGLLPKLRESHFPVKHSVRFVSPSGKEADPFYFSETIEGERSHTWQVERSEFDQLCIDNAIQAGVDVRMGVRVQEVLFEGGQAVGVVAHCDDGDGGDTEESCEIRAKVVVDASGRATVIGRQLGLRADVPSLRKASIWSYYRGGQRQEGIDAGETTVFTIKDRGWFWYIPLPDDTVSVGVVASPDYLFAQTNGFEEVFQREVDRCEPLARWLRNAERTESIHGIRNLAYLNRQTAGDGWLMIGDAAGFLDPIYSSGLYLALASAELASACVHAALEEDDVSGEKLGAFSASLWTGVDVIWRLINAYYDPEFSFRAFAERFPEHRTALIDCLVGDVVGKDMTSFLAALAEMVPPPDSLPAHCHD